MPGWDWESWLRPWEPTPEAADRGKQTRRSRRRACRRWSRPGWVRSLQWLGLGSGLGLGLPMISGTGAANYCMTSIGEFESQGSSQPFPTPVISTVRPPPFISVSLTQIPLPIFLFLPSIQIYIFLFHFIYTFIFNCPFISFSYISHIQL